MSFWTQVRDGILTQVGLKKPPKKLGAEIGAGILAGANAPVPISTQPVRQPAASAVLKKPFSLSDPKVLIAAAVGIWAVFFR